MIKKDRLEEGKWYGVYARNTSHALWKDGLFHYVREKFGTHYIDTDSYFGDDPKYATVKPYEVSKIQHVSKDCYGYVSEHCPFCLSTMIAGEPVDIGSDGTASQVVFCNGCERHWTDQYKLVTFEEG